MNQQPYQQFSPTMTNEPPQKRQRLSPQPSNTNTFTSPYTNSFGRPPYHPTQYSSIVPAPQYHSIAPGPMSPSNTPATPVGTMGPPEKPKTEKHLDIASLNDMVAAAGVDLKKEEDYLSRVYQNHHSTQTTAVDSFSSWPSGSPSGSFNQWSQSPTATQLSQSGNGQGPLNRPTITPEGMKQQLVYQHRQAAAKQAANQQKHLRDPFLQGNIVREKVVRKATSTAVLFRNDTVNIKSEAQSEDFFYDGRKWQIETDAAVLAANTTIVSADSSITNVLALLSLASQNHMRGLLEDAYTLSRARQHGSGGEVPPEWTDIATGPSNPENVTVKQESISKTAWDAVAHNSVNSSKVAPAKRDFDTIQQNPLTPPPDPEIKSVKSIRYPSTIPAAFVKLGGDDLAAEKMRLEKRKKRKLAKDNGESVPVTEVTSPAEENPITPSTGTPAPTELKMTKKERERQLKLGQQTEEVLQRNANETANMQLGGGLKSKYSWMTAGGGAKASSGFSAGAGIKEKLAANKSKTSTPKPQIRKEDVGLESKHSYKVLGLLKEGSGITLNDFINALEKDGKEKLTLVKGYSRLGKDTA